MYICWSSVVDLALSLQQLRLLLWHGFNPWPGIFHMPWRWPKKRKKKRKILFIITLPKSWKLVSSEMKISMKVIEKYKNKMKKNFNHKLEKLLFLKCAYYPEWSTDSILKIPEYSRNYNTVNQLYFNILKNEKNSHENFHKKMRKDS